MAPPILTAQAADAALGAGLNCPRVVAANPKGWLVAAAVAKGKGGRILSCPQAWLNDPSFWCAGCAGESHARGAGVIA